MDLFYCLCLWQWWRHPTWPLFNCNKQLCINISLSTVVYSFILRLFDHSRNFQYRFVDHTYTLLVITSWLAWFGWFLASKTKAYSQTIRRSLTSSTISKRAPRLCNLRICIFFALTWLMMVILSRFRLPQGLCLFLLVFPSILIVCQKYTELLSLWQMDVIVY